MNADQDRPDWLTVEAAARRLGVSSSTVKRRIQDGKPIRTAFGASVEFDREMVERPQGHEWLIRFKSALPPISTDPERTVSESTPAVSSAQEPPAALTTALETIREQSARIASLEREAGRLEGQVIVAHAERDAARQAAEAARTELERERRRTWWDRLIGRYPD